MLIGRSAFLLLQERLLIVWLVFDYICDFCYLVDTFIQTRKGLKSCVYFIYFKFFIIIQVILNKDSLFVILVNYVNIICKVELLYLI